MRETKFRAWINALNCWADEIIISQVGDVWGYIAIKNDNKYFNAGLEQFTGLSDKNGKEIYEGDIIQDSTFKDRGSYIMAVEWEKEAASFVLTRNGWAFRHYFYESSNPDDCEVIGNIHENPELLK